MNNVDWNPRSSNFSLYAPVDTIPKYLLMKASRSIKSNAAIVIRYAKNLTALAGI